MAKNVKYRPATMAEIEERDTDLYMNGERVWVFMINRSQTIGEDDAKLIDIVLTNMKHVQPEDLQVIDDTLEEQDELPESPLMRYYGDLKSKHKDAILLFRCGDFYETYGEDAVACAKVLGITLTEHKDGYKMAGFPHHALDGYLPKLVRAAGMNKDGFKRIAICDQLEDPKLTKRLVKRGITELASNATNNNSNNSKSETTMAKNVNAQDYVGKVLVLSDGKSKYVIKSVDGDKLAAEFSRGEGAGANVSLTVAQVESMISAGKAAWSDDVVQGSKVQGSSETVEEVEEVSAITPTKPVAQTVDMKPKAKNEKPKGEKKQDNKPKAKTEPKKEATGKLVYDLYTNKKGKTCAKISGFREGDAILERENAESIHASASYERDKQGNKLYYLAFGPRYAEAAKEVCDALNAGKSHADCKAIIDAQTASRKQVYTAEEVADIIDRVLKGDRVPEDIRKHIKAAA